jgi:F-type H+-transporting ATPase subunit b
MPQFDPNAFATQLFWLVVCFVALYLVASRWALPRIASVLESRQTKLDDDLDRAAAFKQEAEGVLAEYEKTLAEGRNRAHGMLREAAEAMAGEADTRHGELAEKLSADVRAAETRIQEAKLAAVGNIRQVATEVAQAATRRLIGLEVDAATAEGSVKAVLGGKG